MGGSTPGVGRDLHGSRVGRGAAQKSQHEMGEADIAEDWVKWNPIHEAGKCMVLYLLLTFNVLPQVTEMLLESVTYTRGRPP